MSIDFGTDIYEEPLVSKSFLPEDSGELSLRPHTLREYIGQQKAKENLSVFIEAARRRTEPLDHVLLPRAPRAWAKPPWPASLPRDGGEHPHHLRPRH